MARRKFIIKCIMMSVFMIFSAILFYTANFDVSATVPTTFATDEKYNERQIFDFNYGWRFSKGEGIENNGSSLRDANPVQYIANDSTVAVYDNTYAEGYNDETWTNVSLPHTYNDTDTFDDYVEALNLNNAPAVDGSGQSLNGERTMYGGTAWYKKQFYIPMSYEGKRVIIEFEAARQSAQIWVNGFAVAGKYLNGFIAFGYDITEYLNYGGNQSYNNTITVLVDNSYPYCVTVNDNNTPGDTTDDFFETMYDSETRTGAKATSNALPWHDSHWHPNYGGLYRNSKLYVTDALQLTLPLYSFMQTEGTYIYTSNENSSSGATVNVRAEVKNHYETDVNFDLGVRVFDANGNLVVSTTNSAYSSTPLSSGQKTYVNASLVIPKAQLHYWSPDYPYLYTVECSLFKDGICVDNNNDEIGVRTFRATTDSGLLINENYVYLNGWGQKPTMEWAGIGAAYPDWMQEYVLKQMKAAGGNYIRFGHCAGSVTQVDIADRLGIVITQPGVDGEGNQFGGNAYTLPGFRFTYNTVSSKVRIDAFRDMLILFRNNPSILFWELGNYAETSLDSVYASLRELIEIYDFAGRNVYGEIENAGTDADTTGKNASTRFATSRCIRSDNIKALCDVAEATDGSVANDKTSGLPIVEAESTRYEARRGVWDTYTEGFSDFNNIYSGSNSSYDNLTSERLTKLLVEDYYNKYISKGLAMMGGANWIYSDSNSHARLLSEVCRATGEVDAVMLEKESYYATKVLFTNAPTSHIVGHWNYPAGTVKDVYVVSKANTVELSVPNGSGGYSIIRNSTPTKKYLFTFSNVVYNSGTISVKGYDSYNNELLRARDSITSHGVPNGIRITNVVSNPNGLKANGSDYLILDVEVIDVNGNRCTTYDGYVNGESVNFTVIGDNPALGANTCVWRGGYNSGLVNTINKKYIYLEAGVARVALRTTMNAGQLGVTATLNGFTATYTTTSHAITDASAITGKSYNFTQETLLSQQILDPLLEKAYNTVEPVSPMLITYDETDLGGRFVKTAITRLSNSNLSVGTLTLGNRIYTDLNMEYSKIPNDLVGADVLYFSSELYLETMDNLFTFSLNSDCKIVLMFPVQANTPTWLESFGATATNKFVVASNGIVYRCYEKELTQLDSNNSIIAYNLHSGTQTNNREYMYLIGFCQPLSSGNVVDESIHETFGSNFTKDISPYYYLEDPSSGIPSTSSDRGYTSVSKESVTDRNNVTNSEALLLSDYATQSATYYKNTDVFASGIYFPFSAQTGIVTMTCDYLIKTVSVPLASNYHQWARIVFQSGTLGGSVYDNWGYTNPIRMYFDVKSTNNSTAKINIYSNQGVDTSAGGVASNNSLAVQKTGLSDGVYGANTWYTFKFQINMTSGNQSLKMWIKNINTDDSTYSQIANITLGARQTFDSIDRIGFLTGGNRCGFVAIDNVNIDIPVVSTISVEPVDAGLTVLSHEINEFNPQTSYYYMGEYNTVSNPMPTASDISCNFGTVEFLTDISSREYTYFKKIHLRITSTTTGNVYEYTLAYSYYALFPSGDGYDTYGLLDLYNHESRPFSVDYLYEGAFAYDTDVEITSVPNQYYGAEYVKAPITNKSSQYMAVSRYDVTFMLLVNTHDILDELLSGVAYNSIVPNWLYTKDVVTFSNGYVYSVFIRLANTGDIMQIGLSSDFTVPPIICAKKTDLVTNQMFLYEDFQTLNSKGEPYGWEINETENATVNFDSGNDGMMTFTDTNTDYAYINRNFSTLENKFEFKTEMIVYDDSATTNLNSVVKFIRFWLMRGDINPDNYADKSTLGVECYLHDYNKAGGFDNNYAGLTLMYREQDGNTADVQQPIYTNLPKDKWIEFTFIVNPQKHCFQVSVEYDGRTAPNNDTEFSFCYDVSDGGRNYFTDSINNLLVGTAQNGTNYFSVKGIQVKKLNENVIDDIRIDGTSLSNYNSLTKDFMFIADITEELPSCTVVEGANVSATYDTVITNEQLYYNIEAKDVNNAFHNHRVFIYADTTPLQTEVNNKRTLLVNEIHYSETSWSAFIMAYEEASEALEQLNHNYYTVSQIYNNLMTTFNNLERVYLVSLVFNPNQAINVSIGDSPYFKENDEVSIVVTPMFGYSIMSMTAVDAEDQNITISFNKFLMPNKDVTVTIVMIMESYIVVELGKNYSLSSSENTNITLAEHNAFTAKIVQIINPSTYANLSVKLMSSSGWNIPKGTKITMIDFSNLANIEAYYYTCLSNQTEINLTLFKKMGNTTVAYQLPSNGSISHTLQFIIDFVDVPNITSGGIALEYADGATILHNMGVSFSVVEDTITNLSASFIDAPEYVNDVFSIRIVGTANMLENSIVMGGELTAVISKLDSTEFAQGTTFTIAGETLPWCADSKHFVVPLQNGVARQVVVDSTIGNLPTSGGFIVRFFVSQRRGSWGNGALLDTEILNYSNLTVAEKTEIYCSAQTSERVITFNNSSMNAVLQYNANVMNANRVELSVQHKDGGIYVSDARILSNVESGGATVNANDGIVDLSSLLNGSTSNLTINFNVLNFPIEATTYRLVFEVESPLGDKTIYLQFVISS